MQSFGVSIVICCHNSAERLPATLLHLSRQKVSPEIPWEVLVVDNASTDQTAQVAQNCWSGVELAPLRVVSESHLGLFSARKRGLIESNYDIISFVDDDNWVCPEWVQIVSELMSQHSDIGACGGYGQAVCEISPPSWFEHCARYYALGAQGNNPSEDITSTRGALYGAGLTVRKQAWQQLLDGQFQPLLTGRKGSALTSGDDIEFCYALRLAGWRLWYDSRLTFEHYMPIARLKWAYVRRLSRGCGAGELLQMPYRYALESDQTSFKARLKRSWQWRILAIFKNLAKQPFKLLISSMSLLEGDMTVLEIEENVGAFQEILRSRKKYEVEIAAIHQAPWNQQKVIS